MPDWVTTAAILGLCGIAWTEIRSLRSSRQETTTRLTAVELSAKATGDEVIEVKEIVGDMRDSLIAAGVMKPKGG